MREVARITLCKHWGRAKGRVAHGVVPYEAGASAACLRAEALGPCSTDLVCGARSRHWPLGGLQSAFARWSQADGHAPHAPHAGPKPLGTFAPPLGAWRERRILLYIGTLRPKCGGGGRDTWWSSLDIIYIIYIYRKPMNINYSALND